MRFGSALGHVGVVKDAPSVMRKGLGQLPKLPKYFGGIFRRKKQSDSQPQPQEVVDNKEFEEVLEIGNSPHRKALAQFLAGHIVKNYRFDPRKGKLKVCYACNNNPDKLKKFSLHVSNVTNSYQTSTYELVGKNSFPGEDQGKGKALSGIEKVGVAIAVLGYAVPPLRALVIPGATASGVGYLAKKANPHTKCHNPSNDNTAQPGAAAPD